MSADKKNNDSPTWKVGTKVLVTVPYGDNYGNVGYGHWVGLAVRRENEWFKEYEILEPVGIAKRWPEICANYLCELPMDSKWRIGFYTSGAHYAVLKSLGKTDRLKPDTKKYLEKQFREKDNDSRTITSYSEGPKLRPDMNPGQTELYME